MTVLPEIICFNKPCGPWVSIDDIDRKTGLTARFSRIEKTMKHTIFPNELKPAKWREIAIHMERNQAAEDALDIYRVTCGASSSKQIRNENSRKT